VSTTFSLWINLSIFASKYKTVLPTKEELKSLMETKNK